MYQLITQKGKIYQSERKIKRNKNMNNPIITKNNQLDQSQMGRNSGRSNMGHLYEQMQHKQMDQANEAVKMMMENPDLFDYDADYDRIQNARKELQAVKKADKKESMLIGLIKSAKDKRERETLIRKDRLAEKEQNRSGNQGLKDEKYITSSYLKQLEENKKFEEDDKKKEELNQQNSALNKGTMESFHQKLLGNNQLGGRVDLSKIISSQQKNYVPKISDSQKRTQVEENNRETYSESQKTYDNERKRGYANNDETKRDNNEERRKDHTYEGKRNDKEDNDGKRRNYYDSNDRNKRDYNENQGKIRQQFEDEKRKERLTGGDKKQSGEDERRHNHSERRSRSNERQSKDIKHADRYEKQRRDRDSENSKSPKKSQVACHTELENKISKEEKIRLAKERYHQRQQQQSQQPPQQEMKQSDN